MQPDAVVFSDVGPDVRWVGNERGIAGDPCWATFDPVGEDGGPASPGNVRTRESTSGQRHGIQMAARRMRRLHPPRLVLARGRKRAREEARATDLPLLPIGRPRRNPAAQRPAQSRWPALPPKTSRRSRVSAPISRPPSPRIWRQRARTDATHVRGNDKQIRPRAPAGRPPRHILGHRRQRHQRRRHLRSRPPVKFSVIRLKEAIRYGQRIDAFTVERWQSDSWEPVASSTSIGPRRLIRLDAPIIATRLRLRITQAAAPRSSTNSRFSGNGRVRLRRAGNRIGTPKTGFLNGTIQVPGHINDRVKRPEPLVGFEKRPRGAEWHRGIIPAVTIVVSSTARVASVANGV